MVPCVPITNQYYYIPIWGCKWNWNYGPVVYNKPTKPTRRSLKIYRRKVEEASNLILNLKIIRPVPLWWNWTVGTENSILPWTASLLNSRPAVQIQYQKLNLLPYTHTYTYFHSYAHYKKFLPSNEKILVQFVPDIDSDIVVSSHINSWTWKFAINGDNLQGNADTEPMTRTLIRIYCN